MGDRLKALTPKFFWLAFAMTLLGWCTAGIPFLSNFMFMSMWAGTPSKGGMLDSDLIPSPVIAVWIGLFVASLFVHKKLRKSLLSLLISVALIGLSIGEIMQALSWWLT